AALDRLPQLRAGVAAVIGERAQSKTLVAYVVPAEPEPASDDAFVDGVRGALADILPGYMVPTSVFVLDELPLTSNGKVDRKALLAAQTHAASGRARERVAPRDALETRLAAIWSELLEFDGLGVEDDFFLDLGGQSFLAMRLMARIQAEFGVELELASLFRQGTIAAQAKLVRAGSEARAWSPIVEIQAGEG
ncbi:MAG: non-ribosomal peptide synthetase, partial [Myxococcales bacterium]|nr:non-ribosomal peptide synthetase [Myxococcales bacterium]